MYLHGRVPGTYQVKLGTILGVMTHEAIITSYYTDKVFRCIFTDYT